MIHMDSIGSHKWDRLKEQYQHILAMGLQVPVAKVTERLRYFKVWPCCRCA